MVDALQLSEETLECVFKLRRHLHLFDYNTYGGGDAEHPLSRAMHAAFKEFIDHMHEHIESVPTEDVWDIRTRMPVARVEELFGFYYVFLDVIAFGAKECDDKTVRDKSNVIITHLRHIGEKCESLTNGRDTRNARAMLDRVILHVDELNMIKIDTGRIYTSPQRELLVLTGHSIACDMAEMLVTLAGTNPTH